MDLVHCGDCDRDEVRDPEAERCPRCQRDLDADGAEPIEASTAPDAAPEVPELIEYRVTFGPAHCRGMHANGFRGDVNGWLTVLAVDEMAARMGAHAALDRQWSMIYPPENYGDAAEQARWYPRGEIGRLRILTRADTAPMWQWLRYDVAAGWTPKPVVWGAGGQPNALGDRGWIAVTADGRIVAQHVSSSHAWGQHDVGPVGMHAPDYVRVLGTADVDYRVVPEGGSLPPEVIAAVHARHAAEQETAP